MVHWAYLIAAFFAGFLFCLFLIGSLAAGGDEDSYNCAYIDGYKAGIKDRLDEIPGGV